jgi:UDP-2-acetamido-3-amino-2,3-dideoxy-glucuronate N-acetyltransferase
MSGGGDVFVHASSIVDEGAVLGPGTRVWHFCHISSTARVGAGCVLGQNVYVGPKVNIGDGSKIQNNVSLYEGVTLEEEVFLGPSCVFTNVLTPRAFLDRRDEFRPTLVKRGASVGANATILAGVTIGEYALVGAGAVVTRDVPPHTVVMGNPARVVGTVSESGERDRGK